MMLIKMKSPPYDGTGFLTALDLVHVYIHTIHTKYIHVRAWATTDLGRMTYEYGQR